MPGLYDPKDDSKSACGISLICDTKGASHDVLEKGLTMLANTAHRGAVDAGGNGDGAGILTDIPREFLKKELAKQGVNLPDDKTIGVGMIFLPSHDNKEKLLAAETLVNEQLESHGLKVQVWRDVPTNDDTIGKKALESKPTIKQVIFTKPDVLSDNEFEKEIYKATRNIESKAQEQGIENLHIPSMSSNTIVYKGLLRADQVKAYYPDLSDPVYKAKHAIGHARFTTNTVSTWENAQPFKELAHNGEINTIKKNEIYAKARTENDNFFVPGMSDSGRFDTYLQHLVNNKGHSFESAMLTMVPPAWQNDPDMDKDVKAFLRYQRFQHEPWDGPAFLAASNGKEIVLHLDRGGLRPARMTTTKDGLILAGSEEGLLSVSPDNVGQRSRLSGGEIRKIDINTGKITYHDEVLASVAKTADYNKLLDKVTVNFPEPHENHEFPKHLIDLPDRQKIYGWHKELQDVYIKSYVEKGTEPIGAMGDDKPLPFMSRISIPASDYFKQNFAQVTNPPIDYKREGTNFSMRVVLGMKSEAHKDSKQIVVDSPILRPGTLTAIEHQKGVKTARINTTFKVRNDDDEYLSGKELRHSLEKSLRLIRKQAESAVRHGAHIVVLEDTKIDDYKAPIPAALVVGAVNRHLIDKGLGAHASLISVSNEVNNPHDAALLLSLGASAVTPLMVYQDIDKNLDKYKGKENSDLTREQALENSHKALNDGVMKVMSKMGIQDVESYIGGRFHEIIGLNLNPKEEPVLSRAFKNIRSPIGGDGLEKIASNYAAFHKRAIDELGKPLPTIGKFRDLRGKEGTQTHGYSVETVTTALKGKMLPEEKKRVEEEVKNIEEKYGVKMNAETMAIQEMELGHELNRCNNNKLSFIDLVKDVENKPFTPKQINSHTVTEPYRKFSQTVEGIKNEKPVTIADLFEVKSDRKPVSIDEVESNYDILSKTIATGAMSYGALTGSARKLTTIGTQMVGAKGNSGEGGEPKEWAETMASSHIKQYATGHFGLDVNYLSNAKEIEIKVGQGAKPGEGGQLPADKVSVEIGKLRHAIPGIDLISPPPHHDIYSIEDLTQVIRDIKSAGVKVGIKLVSGEGIGTVAVGVAKSLLSAGLDKDGIAGTINIAGHSGGTAAGPVTSANHAGMPSEIGLREVDQALKENGLRDLVKLKTSGGFKTGKDVIKATILGADEVEFGTTSMLLLGCVMIRKCYQEGACGPGVANNKDRFKGDVRNLERYLLNVANEVREDLSKLGFKNLNEIRGRTDLLSHKEFRHVSEGTDFSKMLYRPENTPASDKDKKSLRDKPRKDDEIIPQLQSIFDGEKKRMEINAGTLTNKDLAFGGKIAVEVTRNLQPYGLGDNLFKRSTDDDVITIKTKGSPGLSFGVWNSHGIHLKHTGITQDYVGKAMSGGIISVTTSAEYQDKSKDNVIAGNAVLLGATAGKIFINGQAGDRFAVRNSGASAVVEGVSDFAAEYMTMGTIVNLGKVGKHVSSGMSGGVFVQYDKNSELGNKVNKDWVDVHTLDKGDRPEYESEIKQLIKDHAEHTGSHKAKEILANWEQEKQNFRIAVPKAMEKIKTMEGVNKVDEVFQDYNTPTSLSTWRLRKSRELSDDNSLYMRFT